MTTLLRRRFAGPRPAPWPTWARGRQLALLGGLSLLAVGAQAQVPLLELDLHPAGSPLTDPTTIYGQAGATLEFDAAYDATKLPNPNGLNLASLTPSGQALAVNALPPAAFASPLTIPLSVGVPADGQYSLDVGQLASGGQVTAYLVDNELQQRQLLAAGSRYAFTQTGAGTGGTYVSTTRFALALEPLAPLPVTLVSFTAERLGADALLRWTTASELNNAYFAVESSGDGTTFLPLGRVAGAGTSSQAHRYQFPDANLARYAAGLVYYRLRQVDASGTSAYSPVRTLSTPLAAGLHVQAYPNPSSPVAAITLALSAEQAGPATLLLTDGLGRLVRQQQADLPAGSSAVTLSGAPALAAGAYLLRVRQGGRQQTLKLVRQ